MLYIGARTGARNRASIFGSWHCQALCANGKSWDTSEDFILIQIALLVIPWHVTTLRPAFRHISRSASWFFHALKSILGFLIFYLIGCHPSTTIVTDFLQKMMVYCLKAHVFQSLLLECIFAQTGIFCSGCCSIETPKFLKKRFISKVFILQSDWLTL